MSRLGPRRHRKSTSLFAVGALFMLIVSTAGAFGSLPSLALAPGLGPADPIEGCLHGTAVLPALPLRVGFLLPTFTMTPYSDMGHSFYAFYAKYKFTFGQITTDLGWLKTPVPSDWSAKGLNHEKPLFDLLASAVASDCGLVLGENLAVTDDVAVDAGGLFKGGVRNFDVLIVGHEEYVTRGEYSQLKAFVADGGKVVAVSGNTFWAEVTYDRATRMETFVSGHGFQFNGVYAWKTSYEPFDAESANWFGSTFANGVWGVRGASIVSGSKFGAALSNAVHGDLVFTTYNYPHDEVNYLRNTTGTEVIARFYIQADTTGGGRHFTWPHVPVEAYVHKYGRGAVVCLCVFGENIVGRDFGAQYFLFAAVMPASAGLLSVPHSMRYV